MQITCIIGEAQWRSGFMCRQVGGVNTLHKQPGLAASKHTKLSTFISRCSHVCSQHISTPQSQVRHVPT